jgi:hypothetical protein
MRRLDIGHCRLIDQVKEIRPPRPSVSDVGVDVRTSSGRVLTATAATRRTSPMTTARAQRVKVVDMMRLLNRVKASVELASIERMKA